MSKTPETKKAPAAVTRAAVKKAKAKREAEVPTLAETSRRFIRQGFAGMAADGIRMPRFRWVVVILVLGILATVQNVSEAADARTERIIRTVKASATVVTVPVPVTVTVPVTVPPTTSTTVPVRSLTCWVEANPEAPQGLEKLCGDVSLAPEGSILLGGSER